MPNDTKTNYSKIGKIMKEFPPGLVLLSSWLVSEGYSYELQQQYRKSGWLQSIGKGAMIKTGDPLLLSGALSALQFQANFPIHLGGRSALEFHGRTHYLRLASDLATLFVPGQAKLPSWFLNNSWETNYKIFKTTLFKDESVGLTEHHEMMIKSKISTPARAIMECISLCPNNFSLHEAYELMEGLPTLRPKQVQLLLEECKSIKVKRLFLYFAERANHGWFKHVNQNNIDLGSGNRSITSSGVLVPKYSIVLPKDLVG